MLQIWSLMTLKFDFWKPCYNYNTGYTVNCVRFLYISRASQLADHFVEKINNPRLINESGLYWHTYGTYLLITVLI